MSLIIHQLWLITTTVVLIISSIFLLLFRRSIPSVFNYNLSFLSIFGIESNSSSWVRYLFSYLVGTCMATVVLTLTVNINDNILLLAGISGILLDLGIIILATLGIIISGLLIVSALIPLLYMPPAPCSALGIILLLHYFGVPYDFFYMPSLLSVSIYFAAMAVGFVGVFLAFYLLVRTYFIAPFLRRYQRNHQPIDTSATGTDHNLYAIKKEEDNPPQ